MKESQSASLPCVRCGANHGLVLISKESAAALFGILFSRQANLEHHNMLSHQIFYTSCFQYGQDQVLRKVEFLLVD